MTSVPSRHNRAVRDRLRDVKNKASAGGYGSEEELRQDLVEIIKDILEKLGAPPRVDSERRLIRGRPDARVGALVYEFEEPPRAERPFTKSKIAQLQGYQREVLKKERVQARGIASNGYQVVLLDESSRIVDQGDIIEKSWAFEAWVSVAALKVVTPQDLLARIGPRTPLGRDFISALYAAFDSYENKVPFVRDSFDAWRGVYGNAVNLNKETVEAVRRYGRDAFGFSLSGKSDVERFLFVTETYLAVLMKLLVARTLLQKLMVRSHGSVVDLLGADPAEGFSRLADRVPSVHNAFEADLFTWFVDIGKEDREVARLLNQKLSDVATTLDALDFGLVSFDVLRELYQDFFEPAVRKALGEFYTTEDLVDEVLDAAGFTGSEVTRWAAQTDPNGVGYIIDPACGSATFLIRVIERIKKLDIPNERKLWLATNRLIGFDIHPFAVAMARSNFVLAVSDLYEFGSGEALSIPIYWADSLARTIEEKQLGGGDSGASHSVFRLPIPVLGEFQLPDPNEISWGTLLELIRAAVDSEWSDSAFDQEIQSKYGDLGKIYQGQIRSIHAFFSARKKKGLDGRWISLVANVSTVQSVRGRCYLVCGNPPWVRIHNIRKEVRERLAESYTFYEPGEMGWRANYTATKITFRALPDYSMAFVEAGMKFLEPSGTLGFVTTSKVVQALYANVMRKALLESYDLIRLKDYSLEPRPMFKGAVNYPLIVVVKNSVPTPTSQVTVVNAVGVSRDWQASDLPLKHGDSGAPWMLAPPDTLAVFRKMQRGFPLLGDAAQIQVGVLTQKDELFYVETIENTATRGVLLCAMRSGESVRINSENLRPVIEGDNVREWSPQFTRWILWTHDDEGVCLGGLPAETAAYLGREDIRRELRSRSEFQTLSRRGAPPEEWEIFRVDKSRLGPKVLWRDLSTRMEASFVPARVKDPTLGSCLAIPAHTTYVVATPNEETGRALAGFLNSIVVRAFLKSYAPRARGGWYRHFSWVVGSVPIPPALSNALAGGRLTDPELLKVARISKKIQESVSAGRAIENEVTELDGAVADAYGLSARELERLRDYDKFMRTIPKGEASAADDDENDAPETPSSGEEASGEGKGGRSSSFVGQVSFGRGGKLKGTASLKRWRK